MEGIHLTADISECTEGVEEMNNIDKLKETCLTMVQINQLKPVESVFHKFEPSGITGVVLLAESHLAIHTWPEILSVTFDVYVCNFSMNNESKAISLMQSLFNIFGPMKINQQKINRGASTSKNIYVPGGV